MTYIFPKELYMEYRVYREKIYCAHDNRMVVLDTNAYISVGSVCLKLPQRNYKTEGRLINKNKLGISL